MNNIKINQTENFAVNFLFLNQNENETPITHLLINLSPFMGSLSVGRKSRRELNQYTVMCACVTDSI